MASHLCDDSLQTLLRLQAAISYLGDYKNDGWICSDSDKRLLADKIKQGIAPADAAEMVQAETWNA